MSIDSDIVRHPGVRLRQITLSVNDLQISCRTFLLPFGRLISVRSVVQLYPGP